MFQSFFKEVLFCNFVVECQSSQLPEQKEGLLIFIPILLEGEYIRSLYLPDKIFSFITIRGRDGGGGAGE